MTDYRSIEEFESAFTRVVYTAMMAAKNYVDLGMNDPQAAAEDSDFIVALWLDAMTSSLSDIRSFIERDGTALDLFAGAFKMSVIHYWNIAEDARFSDEPTVVIDYDLVDRLVDSYEAGQ